MSAVLSVELSLTTTTFFWANGFEIKDCNVNEMKAFRCVPVLQYSSPLFYSFGINDIIPVGETT
jgi:hypothetical protein